MTTQPITYEDLLAAGWQPEVTKGVTTSKYTTLSLCLFHDDRRLGCVQGYGPTLAAAQTDVAAEAAKWHRRHEREGQASSHRRRDRSTKLRDESPREHEMSDDRDHDQSPNATSEPSDERREDWDPMTPETTLPESSSNDAAREEERQLETGEENPA